MKTGQSLTELAQEIERQSKSKQDFVVPLGKLEAVIGTQGASLLIDEGRERGRLPLNDYAHSQVASYLKIPLDYYRRMTVEKPALWATSVNEWLEDHEDEARLVRTMDGKVRAFLSDRYRPLENLDFAQAFLPALQALDLEVHSCQVTETRLFIKAVHRQLHRDVPSGRRMGDGTHVIFDTVAPAVIASNSEVGQGALSLESGVYTKACTNMCLLSYQSYRKYHIGKRMDIDSDVYEILSDETKKLTDAAVWNQIKDLSAAAFDEGLFEAATKKMADTSVRRIEGNPVKAIEVITKKFGLLEREQSGILRYLIEGGDLTQYGILNAVTRASADVEDYTRATDLERIGGKIIDFTEAEFTEVLQAA